MRFRGLHLLWFWLAAWPACASVAEAEAPRVHVNGETLVGTWEGTGRQIASFKGVPFAAPPVGDFRWRAPQPYRSGGGVRQAMAFAPACMQGDHMTRWYAAVAREFGADPGGVGRFNGVSEDCLYLNVWTPELDGDAALPVMVWVHGGSNAGGWSYEPNYLGDRLAERGVVVITIAYRVGPFGFFAHPGLNNGPNMPVANFGWLDIDAALRWVRRHATRFGGDMDNITVMGESSGAANLLDYIVQESAAELGLNRAILQSTPNRFGKRVSLQQAMESGAALINELDPDSASMTSAQLRAIPATDILRAAQALQDGHYYEVVQDALRFAETPAEAVLTDWSGELDLLIGTNADEWRMYLDETVNREDVDEWLRKNAPDHGGNLRPLVDKEDDPRRALDRLHTASEMSCPSQFLAARVAQSGGRAWVYHFSRIRPGPGGAKLGAYHGTEIGYVFDQHEYWQSIDEVDVELTNTVMSYWVQFARMGNPNLPGRPAWPLYRASGPMVLDLGDEVASIAPPDADLCRWLGPEGDSRP